jgi:hypothetical protein
MFVVSPYGHRDPTRTGSTSGKPAPTAQSQKTGG